MTAIAPSAHLRLGPDTDSADIDRVAVDPRTAGGLARPLGSLALDNVTGTVYRKFGAAATAWEPLAPARYQPNEMWAQQDVAASQTNVGLEANVSQLSASWRAIRAGSIVGLSTKFSEAVTTGSAELRVRVNGVPGTLVATSTAGVGTQVAQAPGIDTYVAGDLLDIAITTDGTFAPVTTDVEASLLVQDSG